MRALRKTAAVSTPILARRRRFERLSDWLVSDTTTGYLPPPIPFAPMSRKFSFTVPYAVPVEDLHRALTTDDVWQSRFAGAQTATLDLSHPQGAGTIRIHMTEKASGDKVPGIVSKVLKNELVLSRTDNWQALDDEI